VFCLEDASVEGGRESALEAEVLQDALAVDKLLHNHASDSNHGEAAVVDFLFV